MSLFSTYKSQQCLTILFKNFLQTHNSINLIANDMTYKNKNKQLQGHYRRFQAENKNNIDIGLILYYNNTVQRLRKCIELENRLEKPRQLKYENPFMKRYTNYQQNQKYRSKIDMSEFIQ